MKVVVTKTAFFGGRRLQEGAVIDYPVEDASKLPTWAVPEGEEVKKPTPMRAPGKPATTMHEMAGQKQSVQAKANVREANPGEDHKAPQSKVVSTKGNTAKGGKAADAKAGAADAGDDILN